MIDALCQAVVTQLNAAVVNEGWSPSFSVVFDDAPDFDAEELGTLRVVALPNLTERTWHSRTADLLTHTIDIGIMQRAPLRPSTGADPIIALAASLRNLQQTIAKWLLLDDGRSHRTPPDYLNAALLKVEHIPIYDATLLRNERRFQAVMRLIYQESTTS